jgi:hypothetical protein
MMRDVYIGWDNGGTGSIGIIKPHKGESFYSSTPTKQCVNYTKEKQVITRVDKPKVVALLEEWVTPEETVFCCLERPLTNPGKYYATVLAARAFEACIIILEELQIDYDVIDSRIWQKDLFPQGTKGEAALKQASFDIGLRLFPNLSREIIAQNDADGILIAEYIKRRAL